VSKPGVQKLSNQVTWLECVRPAQAGGQKPQFLSRAHPTHCTAPARSREVALSRGKDELIMARRDNPNWGKPEPIGPVVPTVTSFEQAVKKFKLQPVSNPNGVAMLMGAAGNRVFWRARL
jgi:hypothetical protein